MFSALPRSVTTQAFPAGLVTETVADQRCELQPPTLFQKLGADVRRMATAEGRGKPGCPARRACSAVPVSSVTSCHPSFLSVTTVFKKPQPLLCCAFLARKTRERTCSESLKAHLAGEGKGSEQELCARSPSALLGMDSWPGVHCADQ